MEDFLRGRKERHSKKRAETERKMEVLKRRIMAFPDNHRKGQFESGSESDGERRRGGPSPAARVLSPSGNQMFLFWALQWLSLLQQQHILLQQNGRQSLGEIAGGEQRGAGGISGPEAMDGRQQHPQAKMKVGKGGGVEEGNCDFQSFSIPMSRHIHLSHHTLHPPTLQYSYSIPSRKFAEENAKVSLSVKKCLNCFADIHRNAPTCPNCKQKIISKAAKRVRK